jgi:hypothetical protein
LNFVRSFGQESRRHGVSLALCRLALQGLLKILRLRMSLVSIALNTDDYPCPPGYNMSVIHAADLAMKNLVALHRHRPGLERGDLCVATLHGNDLAGYTLYSQQPTRVYAWLEFYFQAPCYYSYADFTADDHRGHGLSPARWSFARRHRRPDGGADPTISIMDLHNLSAWHRRTSVVEQTVGFVLAFEWGRWSWALRSPGCRRSGCGVRRCADI